MATKFWRPRAGAIPNIATVTITGTPAATDTVTVDINDSALTVTLGTLVATTDVANALAAAWNAKSSTDGLTEVDDTDETRNVGGQQLPEFVGISAVAISNTLVLTSKTPGVPFTATVSKTGTVAIAIATTQAATGPNHADNADNWSGGALPVAGDTMVFDSGIVSVLFGLAHFRDNTIDYALRITGDFRASIGLPWWNPAGYQEYLDRFLELYDQAGARSIDIDLGSNGGLGAANTVWRLDGQSQTVDEIHVNGGMAPGGPLLEIHGGATGALSVNGGNVSIDPDDAQQTGGLVPDTVFIGASDGSTSNPVVSIGRLTAWASGDSPIVVTGGVVTIHNALDPGTAEGTPLTISGGIVKYVANADLLNVVIKAGVFEWIGKGTGNGTITVWPNGTLDLSKDARIKTPGTINAYPGATIKMGTQTPTITPQGCFLEDINIER